MTFTSPLLRDPALMREAVVVILASADMPSRGAFVQGVIAEVLTAEDKAVMQNPRGNGRAETVWSNHVYRAFRQLKASGLVAVVAPGTYELTDSGRDAAKANTDQEA